LTQQTPSFPVLSNHQKKSRFPLTPKPNSSHRFHNNIFFDDIAKIIKSFIMIFNRVISIYDINSDLPGDEKIPADEPASKQGGNANPNLKMGPDFLKKKYSSLSG
jgi:hypothetical protein